ncbi:integrase core domain-containing protein [Pontiella desulfatans]|nr:integrase core domain-containing protein [Pontiella desulfatans]
MDGTDGLHKKFVLQIPHEVQLIALPNGFCECYIGKIKSECLNSFICFSMDQLDYISREWLKYYHNHRPHQGKDIGNKILRPDFKPTDKGEIKREQRLGGVISWYYRAQACAA